MNLNAVVTAFRTGNETKRAVKVLSNFNHPLNERDLEQIQTFMKSSEEAGGIKRTQDIPENIASLLNRPCAPIHALSAAMCIMGVTKIQCLDTSVHRTLQKYVLPSVAALLTTAEWGVVLNSATAYAKVANPSVAALRCAEEVLRNSIKVASSAEADCTLFDSWSKLLALVIKRYAAIHASKAKHPADLTVLSVPTGRAAFLTSVRFLRLQRMIQSSPSAMELLAPAVSSCASNTISDRLPLALLVNRANPLLAISKDTLTTAIKNAPGLVHNIMGGTLRVAPGSITVSNADDLILYCLYNMALTSCSQASSQDYLVVLQAIASDEMKAYIEGKFDDAIGQLINPFVNNPKVYTVGVAKDVAEVFARVFFNAGLAVKVVGPLTKLVAQAMMSRCRSGDEKAGVITVLEAMCRAAKLAPDAPTSSLVSGAEIQPIIRTELDSAAASSLISWQLIATTGTANELSAVITPLLKGAVNKEALRRQLLTSLPIAYPDAPMVTKPLLEECGDVEVYRSDAFLSLGFAPHTSPSLLSTASKVAVRAEVINGLGGASAELQRAAAVAQSMASAGQFGPLVLLMTHRSGRVRKTLTAVLKDVCGQSPSAITVWDTMVNQVFGLTAEEAPSICRPRGAGDLLRIVAPLLLRHTAKLVVHQALIEILLCCGHDHIVGEDPLFFTPDHLTIGQYRSSSVSIDRGLFEEVFDSHKHLLLQHSDSICAGLVGHLTGAKHVAAAAARALSLYLHVATPAITASLFQLLNSRLHQSVEYFSQADALDAAIASGSLAEYERATLTQRNLIKEYTAKPPKGVSEEDYEDIKKKDAIALKTGRETLAKEIAKRRPASERRARENSAVFIALRIIGATGGCDKNWNGIPVVFPELQSILSIEPRIPALYTLALDAIANLISSSSLGRVVRLIAETVGRLRDAKALQASDVATISAIAHLLRQENIVLLPPSLFCVMIPFCMVAFKSSVSSKAKTIPVATQHQLLSVLNANAGQEGLPERAAAMEMYFFILQNFPGLYKTVQNGAMSLISKLTVDDLKPLYDALMNGANVVKECAAGSFCKLELFDTCRLAMVVAAVMQGDDSTSVNQCMTVILKQHNFTIDANDWEHLLWLLRTYGHRAVSINRLCKVMDQLLTLAPASQTTSIPSVIALGGMPAVRTLELLAKHCSSSSTLLAMDFLCLTAENSSSSEDLMQAVLNSGKALLQKCTLDALTQMAPTLQPRLKRPPTSSSADHKEQYHAIAIVWLTVIGCRVNDVTFLEGVIDQQAAVLNTSSSATVHYCVCDSMAEISANMALKQSPKVAAFAENCLKVALSSGSYSKKKAHACGLAGVAQGLGLTSLRQFKIMEAVQTAAKEKQAQRSGSMIVIEVLADVFGCNFEPYALSVMPLLLEAVAEKDVKISECADDAAKAVMRNLSDVGLRQLIPKLVEGLQSDQTKKRTPSLGFIGYVAFCSPKQLAATLPNIMRHICDCLFDANSSVSNAAHTALKRVAGVVSNPEIQEHIDSIIVAMRSPSTDTEAALDALLYTRFINVVDPASLALIVPVIKRGLGEQMRTKAKAAQITAAMVNLVADRKSLTPYVDDLLLLLENAAQDPMNDVRTTSAKAISALAAVIPGVSEDVCEWVFVTLNRNNTSAAEKAGAAQVLSELVSACGDKILSANFEQIAAGMVDENAGVREAYLHLMIYAPSTFPQTIFQDFLPISFKWVLQGLSDFSERVRNVALTAGSSIIGLYGTRNLGLVLNPLLEGVISEISNLRHSSMLLGSKLLIHLVNQVKKKLRIESAANEEAENADGEQVAEDPDADDTSLVQGGEIRVETARDAEKRGVSILGSLEEQIGHENFVRILSAMHVGRSEHNVNVRADCTTAWQICVASPRTAMAKIFAGIVTMLVKFASSSNPECVDVADASIEYTCARLNENVERFIERFSEQYKENTRRHKIGSLTCLACVSQFADSARLMRMGGQIVACVLPGMQDEDEDVRNSAGLLFERVTKVVGSRLIESVVESQLSTSIRGVIEVVKVRPTVALAVIVKNLHGRASYTLHDLELIENILDLEEAQEDLPKSLDRICDIILACIAADLEGATDVMTLFASILPEQSRLLPMQLFSRGMKLPQTRLSTLHAVGAFARGVDVEEVEGIEKLLHMIVMCLGDENDTTKDVAARLFVEVLGSLEKRFTATLDTEDQQDLTIARRISGRYMLQFADTIQSTLAATARSNITTDEPYFAVLGTHKLFDVLNSYYAKLLEWGSDPQKLQGVDCILDLFSFASPVLAASVSSIVVGRFTKLLFTRVAADVAHALANGCLELLTKYSSGKEKVVESSLAMSMFSGCLKEITPARLTCYRIVRRLVRKNALLADSILGTVGVKKATIESNTSLKSVFCRFVSFVVREGKIERAHRPLESALGVLNAIWDKPENALVAAAAGSGMGSACMSASVSDAKVEELCERALASATERRGAAVGGLAAIYALLTAAPRRLPANFVNRAAAVIRSVAPLASSDKLSSLWVLRCAARLALAGESFKAEMFHAMLRRVDAEDEVAMSTNKFFCDAIVTVDPSADVEGYNQEESALWREGGNFDADLDDESVAEVYI